MVGLAVPEDHFTVVRRRGEGCERAGRGGDIEWVLGGGFGHGGYAELGRGEVWVIVDYVFEPVLEFGLVLVHAQGSKRSLSKEVMKESRALPKHNRTEPRCII